MIGRCFNMRSFQLILACLLITLSLHSTSYADITPVSDRTSQVRDAIITAAGVNTAPDVTDTHVAAITSLNLRAVGITELQFGDFSGMTGLTSLNLYGNELRSLPDGIFEGLTALTTLRLGGNTVDPMPITVSIEKVGDGQFKAVAPTGAPFDIVLPISATNGSISDNTTSITIVKGNTDSSTLTITRIIDTTAAVTTNIGTLPSLPANHYGYLLSKSIDLPVETIAAVTTTEEETTPTPPPAEDENVAPIFTDGANTTRSIAENTAAETNIGTAVSATDTDNDSLTYTLSDTDAASFDIDSSSGQLKTKTTLDYETKKIYTITITVSDGSLTDTITVVISIVDVSETTIVSMSLPVSDRTTQVRDAIVAAVPNVTDAADVTDTHLAAITVLDLRNEGITSLQTGDFSGLTALTSLNLYGNMLSSLPYGIFEGLTSLTSLRLGGNLLEPMPLIASIQQVATGQFRVVISEGAPFDISVPVNGSTVTISQGSTASTTFTSTINVSIGTLPSLPANHYGYVLAKSAVCSRTSQVVEAITAVVTNVTDCNNVTEVDLAIITSLDLSSKSITSLQSNDFAGLLSLSTVDLSSNELSSLPAGIFKGLTALTSVELSGNTADPISLTVVLEKVGTNQIKAVIPTGAPFSITLPITVANGSLSSGTTLTIPTGSVESTTETITRTPNTIGAVTANIGTLPSIPSSHSGYALAKVGVLPLEIFSELNVAPVFTDGTTITRTIAENTAADTNIGSPVSATDANNDTLTYTLTGTDAASFSIVSTTGQLKTKAALDYETKMSYTVTITVSDGNLTDTISVTINVTDVDENRAPVFTDGESTTRSVAENTAANTNIGTAVSATDADDDTLTYTLTGTDAAAFSIDSTSGQLRTKSALDYETKKSYSVSITVSDSRRTDSISVTINITDVDETPATTTKDTSSPNKAPVFADGDSTTRTVAENTGSGVDIGSAVSATDTDTDTLTYSLNGTDASSFSIDSSSGQLRTSASLDYETKESYSVTVEVSDSKGGSDSISVTINVTDLDETAPNNAPVFTTDSTTRSIAENTAADTNIGGTITATDADSDTLTYMLSGTNASDFNIVNSSGQLKTKGALNHESKSSYSVTITASDGKGDSDSISVTISVTDVNESPIFADGATTTRKIAENVGENINIGKVVSASDPDDGTKLEYTLNGTNAESFNIESTTGQLKTKVALDFETKPSYSVIVKVSDGTLTDSIAVTINVTDLDETPSNIAPVFDDAESPSRSVAENTPAGRNIGAAVSATDTDSTTLAYLLSGDDASSFSIDDSTGQLKTSAVLNYEDEDEYTVKVTVSDGNSTDTIDVTISVTDVNEAPIFADDSITLSVAENTATNTNIGSAITATDPDGDDLTYSLEGTDASSFDIVSTTGQLKTKAALDYEDETSYSVTLKVSDDNLTDTISITINVTDVDENRAPTFASASITRAVAENTGPGVNIGDAVSATDADEDTLTYTLSGTDETSFDINSTNGQLRTKAALDYEDKSSYSVTVTASDSKKSDTIDVTINVMDVNENRAPSFTGSSISFRISDIASASVGDSIGFPITASDDDDDTLEYSLGGDDTSKFTIDSSSAQLKVTQALIDDTSSSYSIKVIATDPDNATAEIPVTIYVTRLATQQQNTNNAPTFDDGASTIRFIDENTASGQNIGDPVSASDDDTGDTLTYTLEGTDAASFSIVSTSGHLQTSAALDYETKSSYSVTVKVTDDSGASNNSATITVTINVTQVCDKWSYVEDAIIEAVEVNSYSNVTQEHLNSITSLDLTDLQLGYEFSLYSDWSDQFCDLPSLTQIDLSHNDLGRVSDNAFSGLSSLTHLDLGNTAQSIYSTNTRLILAEDAFAGLSSLTHLHLDFCIMWSLPAGIFDGLSSLTRLDLNHNKIDDDGLPTDVFDGLSSLTELELSVNEITILPSDIFAGLSSLTYLSVSHNDIDNDGLPTDVFAGLSSLKELHLYGNKLTSVPSGIFDGLSSLTTLTLFNNNLTSLPSDVFDGLSSLKALRMSGYNHIKGYNKPTNSLTSLPSGIFDGLSSLTELLLGGNKLSSLSSDVFAGLSSLTELTLGGNSLTTLPSNIFAGLSSLTFLGLSGNSLTNLPSGAFAGLSSLTYLGLAENSLTSLPSDVFDGLSSLTELTLKDNSLSSLPSDVFAGLSSLTSLNLLDNSLTSLPSFTGLSSLTDLGLANNSLTSLPSLTGLSSLSRLNISNNNLSSLSSDVFAGLSSLTLLNLSENNLTSLPDGLFSGLTSLEYLSLQGNNTDPMNITVTLVKEGDSSIKVSIPIGAPFDVIVPVTITNGSLDGGATTITISRGSVESDAVAVTRTAGTTAAVTAGIGTLPGLPTRHSGYTLVKASTGLPLTVLDVGSAPSKEIAIPSATALLANYPNPFNPETWIPYQLTTSADVSLTIYDIRGVIVRELKLGRKSAGYYQNRARAIHWDGRNSVGERVGNGVYFYQLQAGKMSYMRKMVILK